MTERRERGWLPEGGNPPRRGVLEDTLFRRLEEMRKKPPGELFELLERTLEVLRATKEALLEQRREIRSLATAVDTLRRRVDQLVQPRPDYAHRQPEPEPEPERDPQPAPDAEQVLEPVIEPGFDPAVEPEPEDEPEPEPDLLPAAGPSVELPPVEQPSFERPGFEQPRFDRQELDHVVVETAPEATFAPTSEPTPEPVFEPAAEHVLMLSTAAGYRILIGDGAEPGSSIDVDGVVFRVAGRMSSPFPGDTRTAFFATRSDSTRSDRRPAGRSRTPYGPITPRSRRRVVPVRLVADGRARSRPPRRRHAE